MKTTLTDRNIIKVAKGNQGMVLCICLMVTCLPNWASYAQPTSKNQAAKGYPKALEKMIAASEQLEKTDIEEAHRLSEQALAAAQQYGDPYLMACAQRQFANTTLAQGRVRETIGLYESALFGFKQLRLEKELYEVYNKLGSAYYHLHDWELSRQNWKLAADGFKSLGDKKSEAKTLANIALIHFEIGEYAQALALSDAAMGYFEKMGDEYLIATICSNKGNTYFALSHYPKALENFQRARQIFEQQGTTGMLAITLNNIALIYQVLSNPKEALKYQLQALDIFEKMGNRLLQIRVLTNIASSYSELGHYEQALNYIGKSLEMSRIEQDTFQEVVCLSKKCEVFNRVGRHAEALALANDCLRLVELGNLEFLKISALAVMSESVRQSPDEVLWAAGIDPQQRYPLAIGYQKERISIAERYDNLEDQYFGWKLVSELYEQSGRYPEALEAFKRYSFFQDSIADNEVKLQIARQEVQYEFDKKEATFKLEQQLLAEQLDDQKRQVFLHSQALQLGRKQNEIDRLALLQEQNERREKERALELAEKGQQLKEAEIEALTKEKALQAETLARRNFLVGLLLLGVLAGGLAGLAYYYWQRHRQSERETALHALFAQQLMENTEAERTRIARELHDSVSHELLTLKRSFQQPPAGTVVPYPQKVDAIIEDVRAISRNLHPVMLDSIGLKSSIEALCEQFGDQGSLLVTPHISYNGGLSKTGELHVFRIVQEALTNTAKYANANASRVTMTASAGKCYLEIKDNGKGFDLNGTMLTGRSFGLNSILQRGRALGGEATIQSSTLGTTVRVVFPFFRDKSD